MIKIIGITGPSGSGKSAITEHFASRGIMTVDADAVYHSLLLPPSDCLNAIKESFGDGVISPDGALNRAALGAIVFNDSEKLKLLNTTVLGFVIDRIKLMISDFESRGVDTVIIDAPTLIESGFYRECDTVISVIAPVEDRIKRICLRDGITESKARERVLAQKPDSFYTQSSSHTVYNSGSLENLNECIEELENYLSIK